MKTYKPLGARLLVDPVTTTLSLEDRAKRAGIEIVIEHENRPMPTVGIVIAVGSDPMLQEEVKVGDYVFFARHAGHEVVLNGKVFRQLELQEITATGTADDLLTP